jgi:hypothetical protein
MEAAAAAAVPLPHAALCHQCQRFPSLLLSLLLLLLLGVSSWGVVMQGGVRRVVVTPLLV